MDIEWPQICFFGVFDGHGGSACADYLRDNLHNFVVQNEQFPQNPVEAIREGFRECERNFLSLVEQAQARAQHLMTGQTVGPERSGSCATVVMIIDDMIFVINVGDSRAIMSIDAGSQIGVLSRDHKPDDELEKIRIQAAGGKIYRTQTFAKAATGPGEKDLYVQGPLRVFPGRLSVSKTFGDIEAKRPRFGGNPNVIVCDPDIKCFKVQDNFDFIMIGCDGIFERLTNRDCVDAVWDRITE